MKKFTLTLLFAMSTFFFTLNAEASFTDVPATHPYAKEIDWGVKNNIVNGYEDNTFKPGANVTEEQFVKIYTSFFDFTQDTSAAGNSWSAPYYRTLGNYGIELLGTNMASYKSATINRGTVAELIGHGLGTTRSIPEAVQYLFDQNITKGKNPNKSNVLDRFAASEKITRGELVVFFYRLEQMGKNKIHSSIAAKHHTNFPNNTLTKKYKEIIPLVDDIYIGIIDPTNKSLELELFKGDKVLAGYVSKEGTQIGHYAIGLNYSSVEKLPQLVDGKNYILYFDQLNKNKLMGAYWTDRSFDYYQYYSKDVSLADSVGHSKLTTLLVNNNRVKYNLPELSHHEPLIAAAYSHSKDMYKNDYFSHTGKNGSKTENRIHATGVNYKTISNQPVIGETLAFLGSSKNGPFDAINQWMNSSSHRQVLLFKDYSVVALGVTNGYFTLNFTDVKY